MKIIFLVTALTFLILAPVFPSRAKLLLIDQGNTGKEIYADLLKNLTTVTLSKEDVFFLYDPEVEYFIDFKSVSRWANKNFKSFMLVSWDQVNAISMEIEKYFLKYNTMIVFLLYHRDPQQNLDIKDLITTWNPDYLIILGVESEASSLSVLSPDVVQRSTFISSIERLAKKEEHFIVYQVLHKIPGKDERKVKKKNLGTFGAEMFKSSKDLFGESHFNLEGGHFEVASWCDDKPFLFPGTEGCDGLGINLISILAHKHKFSFDIQWEPTDGQWGSKVNGTWKGILADLAYNGKHLTLNSFHLTEDRYSDFDITYPYHSEGLGLAVKNPQPPAKWHGLIYPFSTCVWIILVATIAIVIVMITINSCILSDRQAYGTAFLLVLAGVFRQSYEPALERRWEGVWLLWWWWTTFVLACAYTSNLVAYLTIPVLPSRIQTLEGLASSDLRILMQDYGSFVYEALRTSDDPSLRSLGRKFDFFPFAKNSHATIGFPKVLAGTHALVDSYSYLFFLRFESNVHESTYIMGEQLYSSFLTWLLPKHTPYTEVFSKDLQKLVEAGIVTKLYKEYMLKAHHEVEVPGLQALEMEHFQGHFMILALGLVISGAVFAAELLCHKFMAPGSCFGEHISRAISRKRTQ